MSIVVQDGELFSDYTKFKAFCNGQSAVVIYEDQGTNKLLIAKACAAGHKVLWSTTDESAKTTFKNEIGGYEIA